MDWFIWFILINISVFVLGALIIGILIMKKLKSRDNVQGIIFLKAGGQTKFWINRKKSAKPTFNNSTYIFDENAVVKTRYRDFIYYLEENPQPIIYDFKNNKPVLLATDYKTILDSDLISKLFSLKELETIKILLIICLVALVLIIGMLAYIMVSGVSIADNDNNRQLLMNITQTAIRGY